MKKSAYLSISIDDTLEQPAVKCVLDGIQLHIFDIASLEFVRWWFKSIAFDNTDILIMYIPRMGNGFTFTGHSVGDSVDTCICGLDSDNVLSKVCIYVKTYCRKDAPEIIRFLHLLLSNNQCAAIGLNLP